MVLGFGFSMKIWGFTGRTRAILDRSTYPSKWPIELGLFTLYFYIYTLELCYKNLSLFENNLLTWAN
jgi:hypothetical protein